MAKTNTKTNNLPNHKKGYIAIYRSIKEHWVYESERKRTRLEAWIDLLLMASHAGTKEPIGQDLIMIDRGQVLTSQDKLAEQWGWDRNLVRKFLNMLMKDGMIDVKPTNKFTIITIAQYALYQIEHQQQTINKPTTHQQQTNNAPHTIMLNNDNNVKEVIYSDEQTKSFEAFEKWLNVHAPMVGKLPEKFTIEQYLKAKEKYSTEQMTLILTRMHNYKPLVKNNTSAYLTFLNWAERQWPKPTTIPGYQLDEKTANEIFG